MKKKKFTRKPCWLFTGLRKQPCPTGYFKSEDDLFHAYVDWLDYYDPIGFVRNWGLYREYAPEAKDLAARVQRCNSAEDFAVELRACLVEWFDEQSLKPHFLREGFNTVADAGWALWRQFDANMQKNPERGSLREQPHQDKCAVPNYPRLAATDGASGPNCLQALAAS